MNGNNESLPVSPEVVLQSLHHQAERKASFKMFYAAADLFRDYRGAYANETAAERARLAEDYDKRGRAAEEARLSGQKTPPAVRTAPPVAPPPAPKISPPPPRPRPFMQRPKPAPAPASTLPPRPTFVKDPPPVVAGGKVTFPCRWCKEPLTFDVSSGGKIVPCPKCDLLVTVPKV